MNPDALRAELESELSWRRQEVSNLSALIEAAEAILRDSLRKPLVIVLYSHLEGFCVRGLNMYVDIVNTAKIPSGDAAPALVAGSWDPLFRAMLHGDEKCEYFKGKLPDDKGLHRHWRQRRFVEELPRFEAGCVSLSDKLVDAESNLKPVVLKRNLFLLGLDHTFVGQHEGGLNQLLGLRNSYAHGEALRGIGQRDYEKLENVVWDICKELIEQLDAANRTGAYRRQRDVK